MGACFGKSFSAPVPPSSSSSNKKERPTLAPLNLPEANSRDEATSGPTVPRDVLRGLVSVQLYDDPSPPQCPYCGRPDSDRADMMICNSESIPYEPFEKLMERGWWRTGNVIFRPQTETVCCPSFAIRMPAAQYQLTKNHRRVLNRWRDFLLHGDPRWDCNNGNLPQDHSDQLQDTGDRSQETSGQSQDNNATRHETPTNVTENVVAERPLEESVEKPQAVPKTKKPVRPGLGPDPSRPPCGKAREKRIRKAKEKSANVKNLSSQRPVKQPKPTLLELLKEHENELSQATQPKHKLEMKLVARDDPEMRSSLREFFVLYNQFQDGVHPGKSKFKTVSDLHWGFVNSPLFPQVDERGRPMGTYHMRYYLDEELIMLSVIDILPHYLVSIYFIYNPRIRFLQPGIYTCLREIALMQELQQASPELVYYNLGFFNDFNEKISYKKQFKPTEILCPITSTYVPLDKVLPLLKEARFCRFADKSVPARPEEEEMNVDDMAVLDVSCMAGRYVRDLPVHLRQSFRPILQHYMRNTGEDVMSTMLLSR